MGAEDDLAEDAIAQGDGHQEILDLPGPGATTYGAVMRVIGSGFGRTGTLSLKLALEELGFGPCYHMEEVIRQPAHVDKWHDVALGRSVDWHRLFEAYDSAVDFPASVVYRELMEAFPDVRVVHTVRDADRWYDSTSETIYRGSALFPRWLRVIVPTLGRWVEMVDLLIWGRLFDGRFEERDLAIERYGAWTAEVIATVPPDRLLVFEVSDGWGPLCEFLEVLQPDAPFPRVNDRDTMLRNFRLLRIATTAAPFVGVGLLAGLYGLIRRFRRR